MAEDSTRYRHDDAAFLRRTLTAMRNYQKDCRVAYKHRGAKLMFWLAKKASILELNKDT